MQSSNKLREIRIGDLIQTFDVLNVLNFSSERKRMSIIIKDKRWYEKRILDINL